MRSPTADLCATLLASALAFAAIPGCQPDEGGTPVPGGTGGHATTTTTTTTSSGGGGTGGAGGTTGTGGAFTSCDACAPETPVCVDEAACAAACPAGRDLCHPAGSVAGGACCEPGAQCCEAAVFGYGGGDLCRPAGEACPLGCPGSDVACPLDTYCAIEPQTGSYACKDTCDGALVCGFNVCCPLGSRCEDGACKLPDLTIDAAQMASSAVVEVVDFAPDACEIVEQCVGGPGKRTLLRFDLRTPNIGEGDMFLGNPEGNPLFEYSPCHGHYHFTSYADYRLRDANGADVAFGHKQAFCLLDSQSNADPQVGEPKYTCSFQGIQAGWSDVYGGGLPCQWVDVTGVPPGEYTLHVALNYEKILIEASFDNDTADVTVTIPENTCPNGCAPVDGACCQPGDPCGWAQNGSCDCADHFGWDGVDCGSCLPTSPQCLADSTCPAGCSPNMGACCAEGDPCGFANDFVCECEGQFAWDDADCGHCNNPAPPCPPNTCPNGCTPEDVSATCCQDGNPCGWAGDGFCDCGGTLAWDAQDCSHCTTVSPSCPP